MWGCLQILLFPVIALPKEKLVDTNGAGDAFVGGEHPLRCFFWTSSSHILFVAMRGGLHCALQGSSAR